MSMTDVNADVQQAPALPCGLPHGEIGQWAERYRETIRPEGVRLEKFLAVELRSRAQRRGYLEKSEFLHICGWMGSDVRQLAERNSAIDIEAATARSLAGDNESKRMAPLVLLKDITMPTASALLHFLHAEPYPVISHAGMWGLGIPAPGAYKLKFWGEYTQASREATAACGVDQTTLRQAISAYARVHMPAIG